MAAAASVTEAAATDGAQDSKVKFDMQIFAIVRQMIITIFLRVLIAVDSSNFDQTQTANVSIGNGNYLRLPESSHEFPHVPICKWASVSNWYILFPEYEGNDAYREFMEMVDDADELAGDISRPGAAELNLRFALKDYAQV